MTFKDCYGSFKAYQKDCAERAIKELKKGSYYSVAVCKTINLFERAEYMMNKEEKKAKQELIEAIERLQRVVDGKENDPLYFLYWEHLKDTEIPSWREII